MKKMVSTMSRVCAVIFLFIAFSCGSDGETNDRPVVRIISIAPLEAAVGDVITIAGENFDPTPGNNIVIFAGDKEGEVTEATDSELSVVVPAGAVSGKISVTISGSATAESADSFTVLPYLELQPDENHAIDAFVSSRNPTTNYGQDGQLQVLSNLYSDGSNATLRTYIKFDLSGLPEGANITSAKLSLYYQSAAGNPTDGHSTASGSNESYIQKVTSSWNESDITWSNQPNSSTQNQVLIPASTSEEQDYVNIDLTNLLRDVASNRASYHGFLIRLANESGTRALYFGSSNAANGSGARPKLVIEWAQ